jgi:hypothetical protein
MYYNQRLSFSRVSLTLSIPVQEKRKKSGPNHSLLEVADNQSIANWKAYFKSILFTDK